MAIRLWTKEQSEPLIQMMEKDMPAFFHMERSVKCGRPLILSDGEECLLAQDSPADPMWIWTSDNISDVVLEDMIFLCIDSKIRSRYFETEFIVIDM